MSVAASPPPAPASQPAEPSTPTRAPATTGEPCPLCGAPLHHEQEWCLRCGAAARTRLAPAPDWKTPLAVIAVVIALSLGVLAAALVKLAGGSSTAPPSTTTVTTAPAATAPAPTTALPGATTPTTSAPGTTTPGAGGGAAGPGLTGTSAPPSSTSPTTRRKGIGAIPGLSPKTEERLRKLGLLRGSKGK